MAFDRRLHFRSQFVKAPGLHGVKRTINSLAYE